MSALRSATTLVSVVCGESGSADPPPDLNTILNVKLFNIPSVISKALTYTLILHPIALAFAVISLIAGLFDLIPGFSVLCFPTCFAGIAGGITLIAFIFDLAIFFIAKSRIGSVSGASANVGAAVWMTLAAWLLCGFAGCAWGLAGCCCCGGGGRRDNNNGGRRRRDREMDDYNRDTDMRLQALRDDQRRQKEQDLPNFQPYERVPQKEDHEDKYLYDESAAASQPRPLRRDGSVLQGVGVGYGRKQGTPQNGYAGGPNDYGYGQQGLAPQRQPSTGSSYMTAGAAGVGAGGGGVDQPHRGGHDYNQNQGYEEFNDNYNYNQGQGHGDCEWLGGLVRTGLTIQTTTTPMASSSSSNTTTSRATTTRTATSKDTHRRPLPLRADTNTTALPQLPLPAERPRRPIRTDTTTQDHRSTPLTRTTTRTRTTGWVASDVRRQVLHRSASTLATKALGTLPRSSRGNPRRRSRCRHHSTWSTRSSRAC